MNAEGQAISSNFGFLAKRYPQLERIGALAEGYFSDDPIVSLSVWMPGHHRRQTGGNDFTTA
jgi:hypothetical protein